MMAPKPEAKERPILFSGPEVRAILEGRKTQTRRVAMEAHGPPKGSHAVRFHQSPFPGEEHVWCIYGTGGFHKELKCPYGATGTRLWVRETWRDSGESEGPESVVYRADGDDRGLWLPSIHMPRWASRLTLEVESVRVERLQDISEEDARAEGAESREDFKRAWNELHQEREKRWLDGALELSPWVWAVAFRRVE